MAEPSLQLGNGDWAGKSGNLLAYHKANNNFYADELTFTRASTGTIVNSDGLIEEVPYNLVTYSEQFDNAGWSKSSSTVTSNAATSPNGDLTADKLNIGSNGSLYQSGVSVVPNTEYTFSFYIQDIDSANNKLAIYDESNASFIAIDVAYSVTSEWTRVTYSFTTPTGCASARPYIQRASTLGSGSVYIWGAQLNSGSTAKTYYPTTTRLNVPRVDYLNNANGSLLLEPQRTNKLTTSSDFSSYTKSGTIATTANYGVSPSGQTDSTRVVFSSSNNAFYKLSVHSGNTETNTIYIKGTSGETIKFGKGPTVNGGDIFTLNGEWQRLNFVSTAGNQFTINTYSTVTARDIEIWGAQVEEGSYSTSYIPTSGTTVTRLADGVTQGGLTNTINSAEGVLYFEGSALANDGTNRYLSINDGTVSNYIYFRYVSTSNQVLMRTQVGGVTINTISTFLTDTTLNAKFALKWKSGDYAFWVNGVEVGADSSATIFTANTLDLIEYSFPTDGGDGFPSKTKDLQIFKTALTDTELATLTTL